MSAVQSHPDASLRRLLRFSLFLQGFAALMMGGATVVRAVSFGWDALTALLGLAFALIVFAMVYTWRRLQAIP